MSAHELMVAVARIEEQCLQLRNLTCDGTLLRGHTINDEKAKANAEEIRYAAQEIRRQAIYAFHAQEN